ncbi:UTP--glucose-1-phosphate uridylyltransferase [Agrilactobacillus yilanensis]|uniref:UTP--glucose-1-phosphate uridylyltransferase n=1 Tax=Agrilactobacillus yilanensis TaxID=2485997 RepID=A0ABW4JA95_9LACO|nr:UTP--glucose-1-phosphate uridylyltransferase [Agrilactobacillus yilanensis]
MTVKKAIIAAGGYGFSLLPATKALPKEILPVFDRPVIDYLVREAKLAGITDILLISGKRKRAIEDYFDAAPELEMSLAEKNKTELMALIKTTTDVNLYFMKQNNPTGIGDALLMAEDFVNDEPFVVMLSDDIVDEAHSLTRQLLEDYNQYQAPVLGIEALSPQQVSHYGIVSLSETVVAPGLSQIQSIVEKPLPDSAPSTLGVVGRYVLPGDFFQYLKQLPEETTASNQLSLALNLLNAQTPVLARTFVGQREDISSKFGLLKASINYGLQSPTFGSEVAAYIKELTNSKRLD